MLANLIENNWELIDALLVVTGLAIYVTASHTFHQRRHPSAAIAWVLGIVLLPFVTLPLYLAFGRRKVVASRAANPPRREMIAVSQAHPTAARSLQLGMAMGLPDPENYQELNIHQDGTHSLAALRRIISGARQTLDVSTFVLGRDVLGDEIIALLKQRAHAGVKVRLLVDGIGIYLGGYPDLKGLAEAGVQVARFVPPFWSPKRGRTNLRNHRKMVLADGVHLWTGGRNLAAEYFEGDQRPILGRKPWLDLSFDLAGELVSQAQAQFADNEQVKNSVAEVKAFMLDRLRGLLKDKGYAPAQIEAVLANNPDDLSEVMAKLQAVQAFAVLPEAQDLAAANKRCVNILRKAAEKNEVIASSLNDSLLQEAAEQHLAKAMSSIRPAVEQAISQHDYAAALSALAALREPVDAFFADVMVMADDAAVRANRLKLLQDLASLMNGVADISQLAV